MVREIGALTDKMAALATNAGNAMEQLFEGSTSLYIYVAEKLEAEGIPADEAADITLLELKDSNLKDYLNGLTTARENGLRVTQQWSALADGEGAELVAEGRAMKGRIEEIQGMIERRRERLFKTKAFKEKLERYETELEALARQVNDTVSNLRNNVIGLAPPGETSFQRFTVTPQFTFKQVSELAPFAEQEHQQALADLAKFQVTRRGFRERNMGGELQMIRAWIAEAQEMDAAMEEEDALPSTAETDEAWLDGDKARVVETISVMMGSKLMFKVKKGTFKPKEELFTCVLAAPVDLDEHIGKKMTIGGTFSAGGGAFRNDMKLFKISPDQKTLTFKAM